MNTVGTKAMLAIGGSLRAIIRTIAYVLLLLFGRVLRPVANVAISVGLVLFLFCVTFRPDMTTPMWAGFSLAVCAAVLTTFYDMLLQAFAPPGVVIVNEV